MLLNTRANFEMCPPDIYAKIQPWWGKNENRKIVCRGIIISSDSVEDFRRKFDIIRSKIKRWTLLWRLLSEK